MLEIKTNGDYEKLRDMERQGIDTNSPEFKEGMRFTGNPGRNNLKAIPGKDPVTDFAFAKLYSIGVK